MARQTLPQQIASMEEMIFLPLYEHITTDLEAIISQWTDSVEDEDEKTQEETKQRALKEAIYFVFNSMTKTTEEFRQLIQDNLDEEDRTVLKKCLDYLQAFNSYCNGNFDDDQIIIPACKKLLLDSGLSEDESQASVTQITQYVSQYLKEKVGSSMKEKYPYYGQLSEEYESGLTSSSSSAAAAETEGPVANDNDPSDTPSTTVSSAAAASAEQQSKRFRRS